MNAETVITSAGTFRKVQDARPTGDGTTEFVALWEKEGDTEHWYTPDLESIVIKDKGGEMRFWKMER